MAPDKHFTFRPVSASDIPLMHEWLQRPHVAEWWDGVPTLEEVAEEYAEVIRGEGPVRCYIAYLDDTPIGFIQSYRAAETHADGWWLDEHDPGVYGIDQFLAEPSMLGQGVGTAMIRAFVDTLFEDSAVTRVQLDPDPSNARAIRSYEKVGFRAVREIVTPDGPALLMYLDRGAGST